ncbi:hypothetical protein HRR83_008725 [Exophiala dermatitidis]|uniref:Uncharacterized protein n=2 Tax=Exophiala dermatitidis TaxID=5970 RepID=H6BXA9_EXODN|nr:uncharacterized protein HMPREF1120_04301 [Exophiala dermatitidis NIH/UT8656]KAJ4505267.1 hypothetical protein HRR73_008540 [Exophiala dermatitidis]EHY56211.1 hypothetical protein HMPREF1120_04301 [Exophiala dermatitidis NIH/UT8656]KAJ4505726.1 hypothetical protein HRR74_008637 [Exophiala dermatitidis]KAJ4536347.1 hypothetical protein HRR77_007268 [Exophiala dermatitidis]KAJ4541125.1 hypothetical protein HRR76_004501 [Exophiala dermatitidis]
MSRTTTLVMNEIGGLTASNISPMQRGFSLPSLTPCTFGRQGTALSTRVRLILRYNFGVGEYMVGVWHDVQQRESARINLRAQENNLVRALAVILQSSYPSTA